MNKTSVQKDLKKQAEDLKGAIAELKQHQASGTQPSDRRNKRGRRKEPKFIKSENSKENNRESYLHCFL